MSLRLIHTTHDGRSTRCWRHLDPGAAKCFLNAEICRITCPPCLRERGEDVPWPPPGARPANSFCAVVAWLAQCTDKTTLTRLLRVSWEAVATVVTDVVDQLTDETRFEGLTGSGVDEISPREGHRYLIPDRGRRPRSAGPTGGGPTKARTAAHGANGPGCGRVLATAH